MGPLVAHCHLGLGKLYRRTARQRKKIATRGGAAVWKDVSAEERSARMREMIRARWAKKRERKS